MKLTYDKQKKQDTEELLQYDSFYMKFKKQNKQIYIV